MSRGIKTTHKVLEPEMILTTADVQETQPGPKARGCVVILWRFFVKRFSRTPSYIFYSLGSRCSRSIPG